MPLPEKQLIRRIRLLTRRWKSVGRSGLGIPHAPSRPQSSPIRKGIDDDCAVLRIPPGHEALVTTDFSLEGTHFRRQWHPPESVGHRCLARGLSDIAAMGGEPLAIFLSLALPPGLPQSWVDKFVTGLLALAGEFVANLAGGDIAESPNGVLADITLVGSAPRGTAILRSGAKPGDKVYVTGSLGGSASVLSRLLSEAAKKIRPRDHPAHFFPTPRIAVGRYLRTKKLASAMIDVSDGLSTDLHHICEESRVGARIHADRVPRAEQVSLDLALNGGEDYELLFTAPQSKQVPRRIAGVPITNIGETTSGRKIVLVKGGSRTVLPARGWEHFKH